MYSSTSLAPFFFLKKKSGKVASEDKLYPEMNREWEVAFLMEPYRYFYKSIIVP